jgi:hypothetical protein
MVEPFCDRVKRAAQLHIDIVCGLVPPPGVPGGRTIDETFIR